MNQCPNQAITERELYHRLLNWQGENFLPPADLEVVYAFTQKKLGGVRHYALGVSTQETALWLAPLEETSIPFRKLEKEDIRVIQEKFSGEYSLYRKGFYIPVHFSILLMPMGQDVYFCNQYRQVDSFQKFCRTLFPSLFPSPAEDPSFMEFPEIWTQNMYAALQGLNKDVS